jgi:hypothetical protein
MNLTKNQIGLLQEAVQDLLQWCSRGGNEYRERDIKELQEILLLLEREDEGAG